MNRFYTIFLMVLSTTVAEPPSYSSGSLSTTYGAPAPSGWESVSSGYSYTPSIRSTHYISHPIGRIPSEGAYIDSNLLEKVKQVILAHEQNSGSSIGIISPSTSYGVPKSTYGPPSGWSQTGWVSRVTDLHFDHPIQSYPAAYYIGRDYAQSHKGWTVSKPWKPSTTYGAPSKPSITYGAPSW